MTVSIEEIKARMQNDAAFRLRVTNEYNRNIKERNLYLDIETEGLKADFARVLSWCACDDHNHWYGRVIKKGELLSRTGDKNLLRELLKLLYSKKYDRLVTFFGSRFDVPFLRARCLKQDLSFPHYRALMHTDIYFMGRNRLCISRKRLANVCKLLGIPAKTHPLDEDVWERAKIGESAALRFIWTHNKEDVLSTRLAFQKLHPYSLHTKTSI